jgi:hypothetical protein
MRTTLGTRITRAALKAARPARRHVVRALRHHSARTRALASQWREAKPVDGIRLWFNAFFAALRQRAVPQRLALRRLMHRASPGRLLGTPRHSEPRGAGRRPRRLAASDGWFAFAAR